MKIKLFFFVFVVATAVQAATFDKDMPRALELKPEQQQAQAAFLAGKLLTRYHYKATPLNEAMSEKIFDHYLKSIDSEKLFFVQTDIDQLTVFRTRLGDAILSGDLSAPFFIFNRYVQRMTERFTFARRLLIEGFDFRQKEDYQYEREKAAWPKSEDEMNELWRKRVKNDWLRLRLAGKDDKSIAETLDKRYQQSLKRTGQVKSKDAFETFMNAYTMAIEPHTNYLGTRAAEDFDISMSLSVVGIGAVLQEKDGYTIMREFVPGSPAARSGQLNVGDRILGVAQGENGAMTDIQGWRLDDTVALIRGKADSIVVLDILPVDVGPDGQHKSVPIIRKKIALEDQAAKKSVQSVMDGDSVRHIGVISLPAFYQDFGARQKDDPDYKSASRDVARLLDELKKEKVDGILIDLRNNGGGSLSEAIDLTGLFVGKGPVVQERDAQGKVTIEKTNTTNVVWDGPLEVLINRSSASASEIFAAAIQDYGRGLVIGEPSFGKGTVQTIINLDQVAKSDKPQFGELKMTIAQFFRVNGGTTQLRGVKPDILFPSILDAESFGESSFGNALPWMQVKPTDYSPIGNLNHLLPRLLIRHETRVRKDKDFQFLMEDLADLKTQRSKNLVSLNEVERRKERDTREERLASREMRADTGRRNLENVTDKEAKQKKRNTLQDDGLQSDERNLASELAEERKRKDVKDIYLNEAVQILSDQVGLQKTNAKPDLSLIPNSRQASDSVHDLIL